jgi:hypothetical protein
MCLDKGPLKTTLKSLFYHFYLRKMVKLIVVPNNKKVRAT